MVLQTWLHARYTWFDFAVQEWDKIWTINKKVIDPVCPRHTAVEVTGK